MILWGAVRFQYKGYGDFDRNNNIRDFIRTQYWLPLKHDDSLEGAFLSCGIFNINSADSIASAKVLESLYIQEEAVSGLIDNYQPSNTLDSPDCLGITRLQL